MQLYYTRNIQYLNQNIKYIQSKITLGPGEIRPHHYDIEGDFSVEGPIVEKLAASELGLALVKAAMRVQPP